MVRMSERRDTSPSRVIIFTRDGRALCAYAEIPFCVARLMRDDLRHWHVGSRTLDYQTADGTTRPLTGEEIDTIEVVVDR